MKLVIFGLTISSSWGNGHATLWRGLCRALAEQGHTVVFFERDVPYYAGHRDLWEVPGGELQLYPDWPQVISLAERHLADADVAMVTSYCPDGIAASDLVLSSPARLKTFYDLDTPVTLGELRRGRSLAYIGPRGLRDFDLVLSFAGGRALDALRRELGAGHAAPLYGSVDPEIHRPVPPQHRYRNDLSYLGTYAEDRQATLVDLFVEPARRLPQHRFLIGGALYPQNFPWTQNIFFVRHLPPQQHPAFFSSSRMTLNVTRRAMVEMGHCPPGRVFEAAGCGVPILSDSWEGLETFFTPGDEILTALNTDEAVAAMELPDAELQRIARNARERTLDEYTAWHRAKELVRLLEQAESGLPSERLEYSVPSAAEQG